MSEQTMTRRAFIARTAGTAAVLGTSAAVVGAVPGANDRISIGMIGTGDRGTQHIMDILALAEKHNVEISAVCDVWQVNLRKAAAAVKDKSGREPRTFTRFGDLLALDDVDAVVIATPDFGHTPIMIAALKAGKDVYVEKPMSLEVGEANEALDLARRTQRVVQVGTQRRSDGLFRAAAREIAGGVLGTISRVSASQDVNHARWARSYDDCRERDVDWDAYLFNREKVAFDPKLLRRWHLYKMCTNGLSGLWMAHYVDAVNMLLGTTYPTSAVAHGGIYVWKDGREHADTFHALIEYPEGFLMDWGMGLGNARGTHFTVHGTKATLDAEAWTILSERHAGEKTAGPETRRIASEPNESHMGNWLECLRTRRRPNADIECGHQHAVATIMAAAAHETGRRHVYDPKTREMRAG